MGEPIAKGVVIRLGDEHREQSAQLAREALGIAKAIQLAAREASAPDAADDFILLLVTPTSDLAAVDLPDLKDRAGAAIGIATHAAEGRVAVAAARKRLRTLGAALGPHELVLSPTDFGYLGLESDGLRERLEVLLRVLANDAERLRLKREGWEEP